MGLISQVCGGHAFIIEYLEGRLSVVTDTEAGILKGSSVKKGRTVTVVFQRCKGAFIKSQQVAEIIIGNFCSEIDMTEVALLGIFHHVACIVCIEPEASIFFAVKNAHYITPFLKLQAEKPLTPIIASTKDFCKSRKRFRENKTLKAS